MVVQHLVPAGTYTFAALEVRGPVVNAFSAFDKLVKKERERKI